jgi:hypothetical protein
MFWFLKDLIKLLIAFLLYGGLAPLLGMMLATRRSWQRAMFGLMMFMPTLQPGRFTFMLGSIDTYRGHVKGYEISFIEVFSLALIIAVLNGPREPGKPRRAKLPPGNWIYLGWAVVGLLSVFNAWEPNYVLMAFTRVFKSALIFAAAALYLRDEKDLRAAIAGLAAGVILQAWICLKMRYVDGYFQIKGWFEHQNPMSMWAYMSACVVFAAAMHKEVKGRLLSLVSRCVWRCWIVCAALGLTRGFGCVCHWCGLGAGHGLDSRSRCTHRHGHNHGSLRCGDGDDVCNGFTQFTTEGSKGEQGDQRRRLATRVESPVERQC